MPFPRTWVEELILEWLQLDGFLALTNLPVGVSGAGGRFEADIVGARIRHGNLEIRHIETGLLIFGQRSRSSIEKKFGPDIVRAVTDYFKEKLSYEGPERKYEKIYVATCGSTPVIKFLEQRGVRVWPLPDFIFHTVLPTIGEWKRDTPKQLHMKGSSMTLPSSLWLLQMLDHLKDKRMLVEARSCRPKQGL